MNEYRKAGAEVLATHEEVFAQADMIVKVKEPLASELPLLRAGPDPLHLPASRGEQAAHRGARSTSKVTGIAYETVEVNRRLPLLEPMSEIAGRMSVLVGGYFLRSTRRQRRAARRRAGRAAGQGGRHRRRHRGRECRAHGQGLGADVTILEVDVERMRFLDITLHTAHTLYSRPAHILEMLPEVDLLIGAVLVPGAKAPKLITARCCA